MLAVNARHITLSSGRTLWVEVYGSGYASNPAILFANGMASTTNAWLSLLHSFPTHFLTSNTLVLHDAANTGKSPFQPDLPSPTLESLANEGRMILEHLGFDGGAANGHPCYWVGHSFGGQQGFVAASSAPSFWTGALLIAPQTDRVNPSIRDSMRAITTVYVADPSTSQYANEIFNTVGPHYLKLNPLAAALAREMCMRQDPRGLMMAFEALLGPQQGDFRWTLMTPKIKMIFGGRDEIAPATEGEYARDMLGKVEGASPELIVLEEAGHWLIIECQDRVVGEILNFVGSS